MAESTTSLDPIAYFSAEFGYSADVPIYAGGLGVLAGDLMKQAADDQVSTVGLGLLYRGLGQLQTIDQDGLQHDNDWFFDPLSVGLEHVYSDGLPLFVNVHLSDSNVWLRVWKKTLSPQVTIYLLDSETDQNTLSERNSTQILYAGSNDYMLKQAILLGVGGVKVLTALGIHPHVFHLNEGRPAFLHWQLIRQYVDLHGVSLDTAVQLAREKTVYTNHTLVGAANLTFPASLVSHYCRYYADRMRISIDSILQQGREENPDAFSITRFALNVSRKANGVSTLHSQLSAQQWPEYHWCNVTNGVHLPTWQDAGIRDQQANTGALWQRHGELKQELAQFVQQTTGYAINPQAMIISWARRLAGYKQVDALFSDILRLKSIIDTAGVPIQILISGKAHQGDTGGKEELQKIIRLMATELSGVALFIPNYHIGIAQQLTRGSDLWLNTPQLGKEACGTSGMKALANGVLNCTVPDGWSQEVNWPGIGWTLDDSHLADSLYLQLQSSIIPLYKSQAEGTSSGWVEMMQKSINLAQQYSAARMLRDYRSQLYTT